MAQFPTTTGTSDLAALRKLFEAERKRIEEAIKAIDVVERARASLGGVTTHNHIEGEVLLPPIAPPRPPEGLTEAVRGAIQFLDVISGEFNVRDIEDQIKRMKFPLPKAEPRSRIAMVLQKLTERGEIELTQKGSGRIPHSYKLVKK